LTEGLNEITHLLEWWDKKTRAEMEKYKPMSTPLLDIRRPSIPSQKDEGTATEEEEMVGN
jgi:hypothetical protein